MKHLLLRITVFVLLFTVAATAQFYEKSRYSGIGMPYFEVEIFRTFSEAGNLSQVYIWEELVNDDLTFVKNSENIFIAEFESEIAVFNAAGDQVDSKLIHQNLEEAEFKRTNSREVRHVLKEHFDLPAGNYEFKMQVTDLISKKKMRRKVNMNIFDLTNSNMDLSDLLFVDHVDSQEFNTVVPRIRSNFPSREGKLFLMYHLLVKNPPQTVELNYRLEDEEEEAHYDTTFQVTVTKPFSTQIFEIRKNDLIKSEYNCVVEARIGESTVKRSKSISFYWVSAPESEQDITLALRQMMFILPEDSLDKYKEKNSDQQKKFFKAFWDSKDPNPDTAINELMEEYFKRVNYATREYSAFHRDGWKTDRGRILIKFGFPDDVERHPFELNSVPFEIWRYYSLRKVFVFVDRNGFGDYELAPAYLDQEYR